MGINEPVETGMTLHLTPEAVWRAQATSAWYEPEAFARDGFIHCTDGEASVLRTGNRYYRGDERPYVVLLIDIGKVKPRVVYEDAERIFPHIYGRLNRDAVIDVRTVQRAHDGAFLSIGNSLDNGEPHTTVIHVDGPEE
ncbi:MAG TPA: DUF952 domain-containing protein [Thermomicrobiales bacterium]|nr:DUF952 domain-containing protein [Thermomicrobiales bacterium]